MKNEYKINKAVINSWAKEYLLLGAANIVLFIFWCVVGVFGLIGVIMSIACKVGVIYVCLYSFSIGLSVFKLVISRFVIWSKRYKFYVKTYGVNEWTRTVEFLDDEIVLCEHTTVNKALYSNVTKILEKGDRITIVMSNNTVIRIYKSTFVEGSWQECYEMLIQKCANLKRK